MVTTTAMTEILLTAGLFAGAYHLLLRHFYFLHSLHITSVLVWRKRSSV